MKPTADDLVHAILVDLVERISAAAPAALADEPDGVHKLRTAVRRLRNVLVAFEGEIKPKPRKRLRRSLKRYGDALGRARDLEVRATDAVTAADAVRLNAPSRDRLVLPLLDGHAGAHAEFVAWTRGPEADRLLRDLQAVVRKGVVRAGGGSGADLARVVVLAQADRAADLVDRYTEDEESAHELRKAGRRLRHVAESVGDVLGGRAADLGTAGSRLQGLLGDHRDGLLLAEHVRMHVRETGEPLATYAELIGFAEGRAAQAVGEVPGAIEHLAHCRETFASS